MHLTSAPKCYSIINYLFFPEFILKFYYLIIRIIDITEFMNYLICKLKPVEFFCAGQWEYID